MCMLDDIFAWASKSLSFSDCGEQITTAPSPPAYKSYDLPAFSRLGIRALDVPQWLWSNMQCRAWLTAFCVDMLSLSVAESEELAQKYKGAGTNIYSTKSEDWILMMGDDYGPPIYNYLFSVSRCAGAVPKDIGIHYPVSKWEGIGAFKSSTYSSWSLTRFAGLRNVSAPL